MYLMCDIVEFNLATTLKRKTKLGLGRALNKGLEIVHTGVAGILSTGSKKRGEQLLKSVDPSKIQPRDLPPGIDPSKPVTMLVHGIGGGDVKGRHLLREQASWFENADKQLGANTIPYSPKSLRVKDVDKVSPWEFIKTGWQGSRKGGDEDAKDIAENIISWKKKYPGLKVNTIGHSMGGSVAERAGAVLDNTGYGDTVKTTTLGAPASNLRRKKNFKALVFERDKIVSKGLSQPEKRRREGVRAEIVKNRGSHSTYDLMQNANLLRKVGENMYA